MAPNAPRSRDYLVGSLAWTIGVLGTLVVMWFAFANEVPRRDEVRQLIQETAPYTAERQLLLNTTQANSQAVANLALRLAQTEATQARIEAKLDLLLQLQGIPEP